MEKVLFPERGSKVENGRVYQPLAFGSTRPRNMMPGHLCTNVDARATKNLKKRRVRLKKIAKLRKDAEEKGLAVYKLAAQLKKGRVDYLAGYQLRKFHEAIHHLEGADEGMRPSDKKGALRNYTLVDKDLWQLDELRGWFNKAAGPDTPALRTQSRASARSAPRSLPAASQRAQTASARSRTQAQRAMARSMQQLAPRLPPAGQVAGVNDPYGSHWINHESLLQEQRTLAAKAPKPAPLARPWKDRTMESEGYLPPAHLYTKETAKKWDVEAAAKEKHLVEQRVKQMQGGSLKFA